MLRIAKTTPGVLDLSAVKDEHGVPVTLIGPSHRDVPDHEESNPVLRRIVELRWVTVSKVPIETPDAEPASEPDAPPQLDPVTVTESDPPAAVAEPTPEPEVSSQSDPPAAVAEPTPATGNPDAQSDNQAPTTSIVDVAPSPAVKPERKSSRRP